MSCPDGLILITDSNECEASAVDLGKPFKGKGCHQTEVAGCVNNGPGIYFSNCKKDSTKKKNAAVCKGKFL